MGPLVLACLCLALCQSANAAASASPPSPTAPTTVAPTAHPGIGERYRVAFELGRLMQEPVVSVLYLDQQLAHLADFPDDASASRAILEDGKIAVTTRATESSAYTQASRLIASIDGPKSTRQACDSAVTTLAAPLNVAVEAGKNDTDPVSVRILSTLDEAELIRPDASPLVAWLKITQGKDAVWAYHLGQFSVGLANAIDLKQPGLYQPELIPSITHDAPLNAPPGIGSAISSLQVLGPSDPKLPAAIEAARVAIDAIFAAGGAANTVKQWE